MDIKPRPNDAVYLDTLRRMTPEQRLLKSFELTGYAREALKAGLRDRFPELAAAELQSLYLERLTACHNQNS